MSQATLSGKKIILGITGSIAAYKAASLTRLLIKEGAEVRIVMTSAATGFISPLTLSTLSKYRVQVHLMDEDTWNNHVDLGLWADLMLIAPLSANTLSGLASGDCDKLLLAVYLSARCPVFVAPAMDEDMWLHPATRRNLAQIAADGVQVIPVGHGELASGLTGPGRMAEPEAIIAHLRTYFEVGQSLKAKKVLITAGPTYEALDPVRFVGNRSSGKMGLALTKIALDKGAKVSLVLGPVKENPVHPHLEVKRIQSALEMYDAVAARFEEADIVIFAAAVADYRPEVVAGQKIKKKGEFFDIRMVRNPDIAASMGSRKSADQLTIGFALETQNEMQHAREKMEKKNLDMIILNSLQDPGAGFESDTNKVTIISAGNKAEEYQLKSKQDVAVDIWESIIRNFSDRF